MQRLLLVLLVASALTACGENTANYFPLDSDQTLTYDVSRTRSGDTSREKMLLRVAGPVIIKGREVYRAFSASGVQQLLQQDERGILEVGYQTPDEVRFFAEPVRLLPDPLTVGSEWQAPMTTHLLDWRKHSLEKAGRQYQKTFAGHFKCERLDATIETPAGTFSNVARITGRADKTIDYGSIQEQAVIHIELTRWYAPGVGLIKSQRREYADSREFNPGKATRVLERID